MSATTSAHGPVGVGVGELDLRHRPIPQQFDDLLPAGHVVVQRRRADLEPAGQLGDGESTRCAYQIHCRTGDPIRRQDRYRRSSHDHFPLDFVAALYNTWSPSHNKRKLFVLGVADDHSDRHRPPNRCRAPPRRSGRRCGSGWCSTAGVRMPTSWPRCSVTGIDRAAGDGRRRGVPARDHPAALSGRHPGRCRPRRAGRGPDRRAHFRPGRRGRQGQRDLRARLAVREGPGRRRTGLQHGDPGVTRRRTGRPHPQDAHPDLRRLLRGHLLPPVRSASGRIS